MFGDGGVGECGVQLVLLSGPPGTDKTHAMRVTAAENGLMPYTFDTVPLCKDSYLAPALWICILEQISQLEGAAIVIDMADGTRGWPHQGAHRRRAALNSGAAPSEHRSPAAAHTIIHRKDQSRPPDPARPKKTMVTKEIA